jgi:hypothetical protein
MEKICLRSCLICKTHQNLTRHHIVPKCFTVWLDKRKREKYLTTATLCRHCHNGYERHADTIKAHLVKNKNKIFDQERDTLHRWGVPFPVLRKLQRKATALINHYSDIKRLKPSTISAYKNELRDYLYPNNKKKPVKLKDMEMLSKLHIPKKGNDYKQVLDKIDNFKRFAEMWRSDFDQYVEQKRKEIEREWLKRMVA